MLNGELYNAQDPQLLAERIQARRILAAFNGSNPGAPQERIQILRRLISTLGREVHVEPPFYCDYGTNITFGDGVFLNFNCVILDVAPVIIGARTLIGPAVQIYTATHPIDMQQRKLGLEFGQSIEIGEDVWIGGGAIICPGVKIGNGAVIGAGSVVTSDIAEGNLAVGNPCRVIRKIQE